MSLVLDSSTALTWIYADETTEPVRQVFELVGDNGALVPSLWRLEVANSLTVAVRRGRRPRHDGRQTTSRGVAQEGRASPPNRHK